MGHTACTDPQCLYKGALYLYLTLHVSDRSTVHHQEYLNTLYTQQLFVTLVLLASARRRQQNQRNEYLLRVYSVEILLKMDRGHVRNMQSTLPNKFEKQCISLAFIIRIHHDARSPKCQILLIHLKFINTKHTTSLKLILMLSFHFFLHLYGVADKNYLCTCSMSLIHNRNKRNSFRDSGTWNILFTTRLRFLSRGRQ